VEKLLNYIRINYLELIFAGFFFILINASKLAGPYILLMVLVILINYVRKTISFQLNKFSLLFALLYCAYTIGIIWTENMDQASKYLENKAVFILFPFLFSFRKPNGFEMKPIYWGLILATLMSFAYGIYIGIPCYIQHFSFPYCFLKSHLSPHMHPTYMSVFALLSMVSAYFLYKEGSIKRVTLFGLICVLVLYTLLLMSLAGLLSILILGAILFLVYLKNRFSVKVMIGFTLVAISLLVVLIFKAPFVRNDINETARTTERYFKSPEKFIQQLSESPSSSETRLVMWSITCEEIAKHPFGVGTGNVDIYLAKNIRTKGNPTFADKEYNPHNQFLQTQLEIGIVGLLILIFITIGGVIYGVKKRNVLLIVLFSSLLLNSLFESMLQLQAGIIFYLYFFMLIIIAEQSNPKKSLS
jgi:O-antigen ligase